MRSLGLPVLFLLAAAQAPRTSWVDVTPVAESDAVRAGSTVRVALQVTVAEGFHVQANHPRDPSLIPMQLFVDAPPGVSYVDVAFPPSTDFRIEGLDAPAAVFTGGLLIGARVAIAGNVAAGPLTIPARLRYQACDDRQCFAPKTIQTGWTLRVVPAGEAVSNARQDVFGHIDFGRAEAPPHVDTASGPVLSPGGGAAGSVARIDPGPSDVLARFDEFEIRGSAFGYLSSADFLTFIHNAETGVKARGPFEGRGPVAILVLVFLGGLALNLTPCVLPMIPINLAIIGAGAQSTKRSRGFLLGAAYGGAMALVYGVLGVIVILTAGTFGAINSTAWFNVGIAVLFVFLGLAMFDVFSLDFSRWSSKIHFSQRSRGTFLLAFSMGAVAALLAGACVAPVVVQVVVFSSNLYASGARTALALPFVLGVGMAVPWPIAGAGLTSLPKPGAWMERVKQVLGVFILAMAAYYGYIAYGVVSSRWVDPASVRASVDAQLKNGWNPSLSDGLQAAGRDRTPRARRLLGDLVQELPGHGRDHAAGAGGQDRALEVHADQVSGRGPGRVTGERATPTRRQLRAADVRDLEAEVTGCYSHHVFLAGPDVVSVIDGNHEDAAVADLARSRGLNDRLDDFIHDFVRHDDFNLHLRQQARAVFLAAIDRRVTLLPAVAADFRDRHTRDIDSLERVLDFVDLVRSDDALNQFHTFPPASDADGRQSPVRSDSDSFRPALVM